MKKATLLIAMFIVATLVVTSFATVVTTNKADGTVTTSYTRDDQASTARSVSRTDDDMSLYAGHPGRKGTLVRVYDFDKIGGTASTAYSLESDNGQPYVHSNAYIWSGFVQVLTPVAPTGATIAIGVNSTNDLLSATTNLNHTGIVSLVPVGTTASAVENTGTNTIKATIGTTAVTAGRFIVYMDYWQIN